jgi:hypothetical protein
LSQTGKEMETPLPTAFYPTISVPIPLLLDLCNEPVKRVERTSVAGGGFSVLTLFADVRESSDP